MTDFLLELLSEEIPARMQDKARADLERLFLEKLAEAGLKPASVTTYATPRRLALIAHDLPEMTEAVSEELKGPRAGAPDQAFDGFLRKTGLTRDQLVERDGVFFAVIDKPGRATATVLAEAIPAIIRAFPWPKSMRWGGASISSESLRWVRPLQGIIAILGDTLVELEVAGVKSTTATVGHRFHHPGAITIGGAGDYLEKLRACHVLVDQNERRDIVLKQAAEAAQAAELALIEDEALVAENAGLTEWPVPLLGRFDAAFLDVPPEVIQLTARVNQKYFVCRDGSGKLANAFVCTANIDAHDGGAAIVAGNEKVLAARLSDAQHFWEEDQWHHDPVTRERTTRYTLDEHAERLSNIVFHEKLGTVADKVERVAKLARWLVEEDIVKGADPDQAERAARLSKADLVTGMVGEFPELQGIMGGYYARAQGEPDAVADAIRDHYKPVGQGDEVPTAPVTVAVSLADKLDTIGQFFKIEEYPTGSKDPFALRRAALGIIATSTANELRYSYLQAITVAIQQDGISIDPNSWPSAWTRPLVNLEIFLADRLKVQQREAGVRHDLIDAVFALGGEDNLVRLLARVKALQAFMATDDGANLLAGYKRAANILKKEDFAGVTQNSLSYSPEKAEKALIDALDTAEPKAAAAIDAEDFEGAMAALADLRAPIDAFFEEVTVNDSDPAKRDARLGLLLRIRDAIHRVADFSKIEG